jgi:hypothetical protein
MVAGARTAAARLCRPDGATFSFSCFFDQAGTGPAGSARGPHGDRGSDYGPRRSDCSPFDIRQQLAAALDGGRLLWITFSDPYASVRRNVSSSYQPTMEKWS